MSPAGRRMARVLADHLAGRGVESRISDVRLLESATLAFSGFIRSSAWPSPMAATW
ncbi:hypothetical protein ACIBQX_17455 [Nonomuraea sp. NPDC049714]|uniref:hypothetical protein n=1 Tax=Nonomuraea sp. NPDC049714 TaxID=3364357 RepID=UPI0037A220DA